MKKKIVICVGIVAVVFIVIAALVAFPSACEHNFTTKITKEATCNMEGEKTYTCTLCDESRKEVIPKSTNHRYIEAVTTQATCSQEGVKTISCTVCNDSYTSNIAKLNHSYSEKITTAATCKSAGVKTFTCSSCGDKYTENIKQTNHNYTSKVTTAATCKTAGLKTFTCSGCGDKYTENIKQTSHNYTSKVTTAATCKTAGVKTFTCSGCGDKYTETIAATGKHSYTSKITTTATCSQSGTKTFTCSDCGNKYTESIAPTGHNWKSATCTAAKTCQKCDQTSGSALGHKYNASGKCTRCNTTLEATINLPNTPKTLTYYTYSGYIDTKCQITDIDISLYSSSSSGLWYEITFIGSCTYNRDGSGESTSMKISYKLYDSSGFVAKSGTAYTESVSVGEKFKETINVYYLDPGETYTLVILDTK